MRTAPRLTEADVTRQIRILAIDPGTTESAFVLWDGAALVECQLETGRQHQIRIHLSEAGHPLVGERVYIREQRGPRIAAPRPMLHARELGFVHPRDEQQLGFEIDPPADFMDALEALRDGEAP